MEPTIIFRRRVPGLNRQVLSEFVLSACRKARLRGVVSVLVTSSREVRSLNRRFKGRDHATDVLSFPAPAFARGFAGDIVISAEIATRNARTLGHSAADEVRIIVLHGILHLAGYDHESDTGEMGEKEKVLRNRLSLPGGLIERNLILAKSNNRKSRAVQPARASS